MTFDMARDILSDLADTLPEGIFDRLDGGVIIVPEILRHPDGLGDGLYILGQYHYEPYGLGRYITINYGSFMRVYGDAPLNKQTDALRSVLYHELTHHLESLAGDRSLEKRDMEMLDEFRSRRAPDT